MKLYNLTNDSHRGCHESFHDWACEQHDQSGCEYSGYPYKLHLDAVLNVAKQYLYLIEDEGDKFNVLVACSGHDLIEDTKVSYNTIAKHKLLPSYDENGTKIADIIFNVTNELGRNRKERSVKTYPKIASCRLSTFVKLCDRLSNLKFSYYVNDEKGMFELYKNEAPFFFKSLHNPDHGFEDMWKEIQALGRH